MWNLSKKSILFGLLFLLAGCTVGDVGRPSTGGAAANGGGTTGLSNIFSVLLTQKQISTGASCILSDDESSYNKTQVRFTDATHATFLVSVYTDSACTDQVLTLMREGTFAMGDIEGETLLKNFDFTPTQHQLGIFSASYLTGLNLSDYCGFDDWVLGEFKIVTGLLCGSSDMPTEPAYLRVQLTDDNSSFRFTDGDDGASAETRNTNVSTTLHYTAN